MSCSYLFGSEKNLLSKKQLFVLSLSSMIGIGVFIKSKTLSELSSFEFSPLIVLFFFSAILISSMIFLFTRLINNCSSTGRSFIEWVEKYCGKNFTFWAVRFTKDFAHPLGILTTSIYLIRWIAGANFLWVWESAIIALVAAILMISINTFFSFKIAEKFQRALFFCIIFSLIFVFTCGIISFFQGAQSGNHQANNNALEGINSFSGWTVLLSGLPSIFFMYDGFYSVLSLREQVKSKTSFTKIILYSLYAITIIYLLIITITLLGDRGKGDFLNFHFFSKDKNWKDVLIILIFLTFASSLNIACMCSQNQLIQLHYKYDFLDIQKIRKRILNRGKNYMNFQLEIKLSSWFHIIKKMVFYALLIALTAQMFYWLGDKKKNIFWDINEILAELVSLFIFFMLAVIIWRGKENNNSKFNKYLHYLVSYSIFGAISYYVINTIIEFHINTAFLSLLKLILFFSLVILPAIPYLKENTQKNKSLEKINQFRKDNPVVEKFRLTSFSQ